MSEQKPSIGRIVHYGLPVKTEGEAPVTAAAIIVGVNERTVTLRVFGVSTARFETGEFFQLNVPYSSTLQPECWTWPPRV